MLFTRLGGLPGPDFQQVRHVFPLLLSQKMMTNFDESDATATPKRQNQSNSDGTMEVTPIHFQNDPDFSLDTPEGRNSGELPNSNWV
uniref:Uncharacterized protein n=1 Tax=Amphimedon queenslandica TaxID=400682 RepID=A0A1X7UPC9_AMPQE